MARIRAVKPEAFTSETLASVTLGAERTFIGLSTHADDRGRFRWQPAVINGALWPLRPKHTVEHLASELEELTKAGALCRYTGCDGKVYGHFVTWDLHQKVDRPSKSRLPRCPQHHGDQDCSRHDAEPCPNREPTREPSPSPREPSTDHAETPSTDRGSWIVDRGPRIVDLPPTAGDEPSPREPVTAHALLDEFLQRVKRRPPKNVIDQLGKHLKAMLGEGIDPEFVRAGLELYQQKPMHPSTLPSLVNEAMNAPPRGRNGPQPYRNPTDESVYDQPLEAS